MKVRLLVLFAILIAAISVTALTATTVSADGGPHRQRTSLANLTSCGECHRAHTAESANIVAADSVYDLCVSCHGGSHTNENVLNGVYNLANSNWATVAPLKGGGFVNVTMNRNFTDTVPSQTAVTSAHQVVGMTGYTGGTIWGSGASGNPGLANFQLQCSTCHDPHGGSGQGLQANGTRNPTYRILRSDLAAKTGISTAPVTLTDSTTKRYYITNVLTATATSSVKPGLYYGQKYPKGGNENTAADNNLMTDISTWCAACHTRIHATAGLDPESNPSGDAIYDFRHRTDGNNVSFNFNPQSAPVNDPGASPGCFTCHVSHGSNASLMDTRGGTLQVPVPGGDEATGPYLDSTLLRLDGRATCEACHNK